MNTIKTQRLVVYPLALSELLLLAQSRKLLEDRLGLNTSDFKLDAEPSFTEELVYALQNFSIPQVSIHKESYCWYTHWLIIHEQLHLTIGGIGACGPPNEQGEVLLGYFIDCKYERQGFATEALESFIQWLNHPRLTSVVAHTLSNNKASHRVLEKCGFVMEAALGQELLWRLYI